MNYLPINQPGETRRRSHRIVLENPEDGQASITWNQQDSILLASGSKVYTDAGLLITDVTPELLAADIPEIDIDTGQPTGRVVKGAQLVAYIQSLYIFCATREPVVQEPIE